MEQTAERFGEIEGLAAQFLKDVDARPIVSSPHAAARIRLKMRRIAYLDHSLTSEASVIANEASLLYGADRDALRRHPGGQQGLKSDLTRRLKRLQDQAHAKYCVIAQARTTILPFTARRYP